MNRSSTLLRLVFGFALLSLVATENANGELSISVADGTISAGGQLTIEIGIESNTPPEGMSDFELILQLMPLTATGGTSLQFVNPQSEAFLDNADYVFATNSEAIKNSVSTVTIDSVSQITFIDLNVTNDEFEDLIDAPVTSGQILASLDVQHDLGGVMADETIGDEFSIVVSDLSVFSNALGDELLYVSAPGTVTVVATAIPEPGFLGFLMISSGSLVWRRRRRS